MHLLFNKNNYHIANGISERDKNFKQRSATETKTLKARTLSKYRKILRKQWEVLKCDARGKNVRWCEGECEKATIERENARVEVMNRNTNENKHHHVYRREVQNTYRKGI